MARVHRRQQAIAPRLCGCRKVGRGSGEISARLLGDDGTHVRLGGRRHRLRPPRSRRLFRSRRVRRLGWRAAANRSRVGGFRAPCRPDDRRSARQSEPAGAGGCSATCRSRLPGLRARARRCGEYNGKFMCGQFVLKGASCATQRRAAARPRNFFRRPRTGDSAGARLLGERLIHKGCASRRRASRSLQQLSQCQPLAFDRHRWLFDEIARLPISLPDANQARSSTRSCRSARAGASGRGGGRIWHGFADQDTNLLSKPQPYVHGHLRARLSRRHSRAGGSGRSCPSSTVRPPIHAARRDRASAELRLLSRIYHRQFRPIEAQPTCCASSTHCSGPARSC